MGPVIAIAVLLVLGYIFLVVPSRRRQRAHQAMQDEIAAGEDELRVEIAPGTVVTLDRRAVAAVARTLPGDEADAGPS
jgi:preprotein translocase subunit YajC